GLGRALAPAGGSGGTSPVGGSRAAPSAAFGTTVAADGAEPISVSRPAEPCAGRLLMAWGPISGAGGTRVKSTGAPTVSPGRSAPVSSLRVTAVIGPSERTRTA